VTITVFAKRLTAQDFSRFGKVIELREQADKVINQGMCDRHHALARPDIADAQTGISLFDAKPRSFPYAVELVERHPLGAQAFIPMNATPMLVIVAEDVNGRPGPLAAFLTSAGQGICLDRNVWHGVLAPIGAQGLYAVVDYVGNDNNLEEHWFDEPWIIEPPQR
jgi:ureidoglycolate lyase